MTSIDSGQHKPISDLGSASTAAAADTFRADQGGVDELKMTLTQLATFMSTSSGVGAQDITLADSTDIIINTTTGTKIGTASGQKIGFYGVTPVNKGDAPTAADAVTIDATYDATEQATLSNVRVRINEVVTILQDVGLMN